MEEFAKWLGQLLGQSEFEVQRLLSDETAVHFFLAWSLFESKCFSNDLKASKLKAFAEEFANSKGTMIASLNVPAKHFHDRYQDPKHFRHLMPKRWTWPWMIEEFQRLLAIPYGRLTEQQIVQLVTFVVYRFRNNMFHGVKKVQAWLQYREEIRLCVYALQFFVTYAETNFPTMPAIR
ncbi:MAG: hypothetical protein CVU57_10245 [Deltaproteobacteria bacterium HGW-Deltaproteobacteria-15]|jgi:hypothetical protein|nr:MAG: hypothetical protein CVU57_10245 [Deltaproteobacteria bacterium HGW-Deltaproteobacteria-15]